MRSQSTTTAVGRYPRRAAMLLAVVALTACERPVATCPSGQQPDPEFVRAYIAASCAHYRCEDIGRITAGAHRAAAAMGYCVP